MAGERAEAIIRVLILLLPMLLPISMLMDIRGSMSSLLYSHAELMEFIVPGSKLGDVLC